MRRNAFCPQLLCQFLRRRCQSVCLAGTLGNSLQICLVRGKQLPPPVFAKLGIGKIDDVCSGAEVVRKRRQKSAQENVRFRRIFVQGIIERQVNLCAAPRQPLRQIGSQRIVSGGIMPDCRRNVYIDTAFLRWQKNAAGAFILVRLHRQSLPAALSGAFCRIFPPRQQRCFCRAFLNRQPDVLFLLCLFNFCCHLFRA